MTTPSCGGGHCGCGGSTGPTGLTGADTGKGQALPVAHINGVPLHAPGDQPDDDDLRQRACTELLRQAAVGAGWLAAEDRPGPEGIPSEAATAAIERLLAAWIPQREPDESACQRYYAAHPARFHTGERVQVRHVLLAVTPGVAVDALRARGEALLVSLRCADVQAFAEAARTQSNCPSGAEGGDLGWLFREDCAPEFAAALFGLDESQAHVGVLPRLVNSRFGFHIVRVEAREPGQPMDYAQVRGAIVQRLQQQAYVNDLRQLLERLAAGAVMQGVPWGEAAQPA